MPEAVEPIYNKGDDEDLLMEAVRSKCVTQLLLLGVLNNIQVNIFHVYVTYNSA